MQKKGETQAKNTDHAFTGYYYTIYKIYLRRQDHWYLERININWRPKNLNPVSTAQQEVTELKNWGGKEIDISYWGSSSIFLLLFTFISSMGWMGMVGSVSAMGEEDEDSARDV